VTLYRSPEALLCLATACTTLIQSYDDDDDATLQAALQGRVFSLNAFYRKYRFISKKHLITLDWKLDCHKETWQRYALSQVL